MLAFLSGDSVTALTMANLPFVTLLVASMYGLGRSLHSRTAGLLAAGLVCAYPIVFSASREFMIELSLLSFTAMSALCLVLSDRFVRRAPTVLFGVSAGLALLTKFTFVLFVAGPLMVQTVRFILDSLHGRLTASETRRAFISLGLAALAALALAALWYFPNRHSFIATLRWIINLESIGGSRFSGESILYYPRALIWEQVGPALFAVFLFGMVRMGAIRGWKRAVLFVWIASIYALCTLASFKMPHNDIGIVLPIALVSAIGLSSLTALRSGAICAVTIVAGLQFATFSAPRSVLADYIGTFGVQPTTSLFPRSERWMIDDALRSLVATAERVAVISDHEFVNGTTAQFYAAANRLPFEVFPCWTLPKSVPLRLDAFDAVIAKSDADWVRPRGDGCFLGPHGQEAYLAEVDNLTRANAFVLSNSMPLPDGSSLLIYRRAERY